MNGVGQVNVDVFNGAVGLTDLVASPSRRIADEDADRAGRPPRPHGRKIVGMQALNARCGSERWPAFFEDLGSELVEVAQQGVCLHLLLEGAVSVVKGCPVRRAQVLKNESNGAPEHGDDAQTTQASGGVSTLCVLQTLNGDAQHLFGLVDNWLGLSHV